MSITSLLFLITGSVGLPVSCAKCGRCKIRRDSGGLVLSPYQCNDSFVSNHLSASETFSDFKFFTSLLRSNDKHDLEGIGIVGCHEQSIFGVLGESYRIWRFSKSSKTPGNLM
ncbi:hypothetical protein Ancab_018741 [Ancistrocladus abbreviatus]